MKRFEQYSRVVFKSCTKIIADDEMSFGTRASRAGDKAAIVEVYDTPTAGYELECVNEAGSTIWLISFSAEEVELEVSKDDV